MRVSIIGGLGLIAAVVVIPEVRRFLGLEQAPQVPLPELDRMQIPRFSFSFAHPVTWDRHDPVNGDGCTFVDPKDSRVSIAAWGSHASRDYEDFSEYVDELKERPKDDASKLLDSRPHGLHAFSWSKDGADTVETREDIPGLRLKHQFNESGIPYISHQIRALYDGIEYGICFRAPKSEIKKYEDLSLALISSLRIIKRETT